MQCVEIQRIPAKAFKSRTAGQNPLMHFFAFMRWQGYRLVQMVTAGEAADVVDEARNAEKAEVA